MKLFYKYANIGLAMILINIIVISCTNIQDNETSSPTLYSQYLEIKHYNISTMTEEEWAVFYEAESRIGIYKENGFFRFRNDNAKDINISEKLYTFIKSQYEHTNYLINKYSTGFLPKIKSSSESGSSQIPDCVPRSISKMGRNNPSYEDACDECDRQDPNWRSNGGVASSLVGSIITHFDSNITTVLKSSFPEDTTISNLNHCVMLIDMGNSIDHAVNATRCSNNRIYYNDYQKNPSNPKSSYIPVSDLTAIYLLN